jgi:glycosyltransferase involved in cell wall biosynthesis
MITYSIYESDNRVLRYAEALAERGDWVDVLALRGTPDLPFEDVSRGVKLYRIQDRFAKSEVSKRSFLWPLLRFLWASLRQLNRLHQVRRYDLIHVHNIPDFLVFATWYPKLTGTKIILDIRDIVPELFCSMFGTSQRSVLVWGLKVIERLSAAMADHVILANHLWLEKYTSRSARKEKCSVFINNVDERIFSHRGRTRTDSRIIVMFPGGLKWHQGLDIAIRAFDKLHRLIPQAEFHIYGDGNMKPHLIDLAKEVGLSGSVRFFKPVSLEKIAAVMAEADLGVVPKRADSFGNEAYSTKIMEFMSLSVPMVVSSTKIDRYYFDDTVVRFFETANVDALAEAMYDVLSDDQKRRALITNALDYVKRNSWKNYQTNYLELVDTLCAEKKAWI